LSYGGSSGRTFTGRSRASSGKKSRRKKQEFHRHRVRGIEEEGPDAGQVRSRTILALDRLGHQVFSPLPGGYDLQRWTNNLNSLLDDYERRIGPDQLPPGFRKAREDALMLLRPVDTSSLDAQIEKLGREETEESRKKSEERALLESRIRKARVEQESCSKELETERGKLAAAEKENREKGFFGRLLEGTQRTDELKAKVGDLERKLKIINDEVAKLRESLAGLAAKPSAGEAGTTDPAEIDRLVSERTEKLQLAKERELATMAIAELIARSEVKSGIENGQQVPT